MSEASLLVASALLAIAFVLFEKRAKEPLLPMALFRNRVFRAASALSFCCGMGLFGAISFVPLFVQGVLFGSATQAGSALTPLMLTWVALSALSGWLTLSLGYRPLVMTGMVFFGLGFASLHRLDAASSLPAVWLSMAILGIGMGFSMVTTILAVQNSVSRKLVATATSATYFFRTIGGTVGVALMGTVITHHVISASRAASDPTLIALAARPDSIIQPESRARLSAEALEWLRQALAHGLQSTFLVGVLIALVAFAVTLSFPRGSARQLAERREL